MVYETALNNFATWTWLEDCIDKLIFLLKWRLKLAKQKAKLTFLDYLQQKLILEYRLDMSSLKKWLNKLVTILKTVIENNSNDSLI